VKKVEILEKLTKAEFLDFKEMGGCDALPCFGCDAGPLPPGCDCICHTPCDFGIAENNYLAGESSKYESNLVKNEVYEMK